MVSRALLISPSTPLYGCLLNGDKYSPGREFQGIIRILGLVSEVAALLRHRLCGEEGNLCIKHVSDISLCL